MSYRLEIKKTVRKQLDRLPTNIVIKVMKACYELAKNPYDNQLDIKALKGEGSYRVRVGNYRIIYRVLNDIMVIEVIEVFHRQQGY